jgi:ABC-type sugar transport system substrate-binding protein
MEEKRMKVKRVVVLLLALIMVFSATACQKTTETATELSAITNSDESAVATEGNTSSNESTSSSLKIGYVVSDMSHEWYQNISKGANTRAEATGVEIQIVDSGFDSATQISAAENMITSGVDVLILTPVDAKALTGIVEMAHEANIPVICESNMVEGADHLVSIDNLSAGKMVGEFAVNYLEENNITDPKILIMGQPTFEDCRQRVQGFKEAFEESGISYEIVQEVDTDGTKETSLSAAANALIAHPEVNLIFGINDNTAIGAMNAFYEAGLDASNLIVVGIGLEGAVGRESILSGKYTASLAAFPFYVGATLIDTAIAVEAGEELPEHIALTCKVLTKDTFSEFYTDNGDGTWTENFDAIDAYKAEQAG